MQRTTARLLLRPPEPGDLPCLYAIYGDPATNTFNPAGPLTDIDQARTLLQGWREQWRDKGIGPWAIALRSAPDKLIGFGGISSHGYLGVERINVGYRFDRAAWGAGYATELGAAALAFGFDECRLPEIFALVRPAHLASIRVLEKIGMQRFATLDDVPGQAPSIVFRAARSSPASALPSP